MVCPTQFLTQTLTSYLHLLVQMMTVREAHGENPATATLPGFVLLKTAKAAVDQLRSPDFSVCGDE